MVALKRSHIESWQQSPQVLASTVVSLGEENQRLESFLQQYLSLDTPSAIPTPGIGLSVREAVYIRLYYYNVTLDIHTIFSNPWSQYAFRLNDHADSRLQMEKSIQIVAKTARNAILASQYIQIDASTPLL